MRFLTRSLLGLFLLTLTAGLLALAGNTVFSVLQERASGGRGAQEARERVFTVEVIPFRSGTHVPVIETFGEVVSGRTLEIRAPAAGRIVALSPNFREGGSVAAGELLFQTDPANAETRLAVARNELAEAEADLAEAEAQLPLAEEEVRAAEVQLELRRRSLERQRSLVSRGVGTDAATEAAELNVSAAEQTLIAKRQALANVKARIARARTALERRRINLAEAERLLADTTVRAPFAGVLADVTAVLGRLVNANERLGNLIDPGALEVAFRISSEAFNALSAAPGGLEGARVRVEYAPGGLSFEAPIARVSAAVGEGRTGRELFARLGPGAMLTLRPGDFVSVEVYEPPLSGVARIPASAVNAAGEVLVVGPGERLEAARVEVLRKQGDDILVRAEGLEGRQIVAIRAPRLGAGIKVRPRAAGDRSLEERETVELNAERRARLKAAVEGNTRMPEAARARVLAALDEARVPREMVERIEARMGAAAAAEGEMVSVPEEQRRRMIAFIEANEQIPAERKAAIIEALGQERLPRAMVERITQRMGG